MQRIVSASLILLMGLCRPGPLPAQLQEPNRPVFSAEAACLALNALELPELAAIRATWVPAGPAPPGLSATESGADEPLDLPDHCVARGTIVPTIRFEVWLPGPGAWNGRFLGVGGGGYAGEISLRPMSDALVNGYATASTDTGHAADDFEWIADDASLRDFGYRAIFEMTEKADAILNAFYSRPPDYRYFNGCSLGGRQGLMEAQRFPTDYDGIVAGAPVNAFVGARTTQLWLARSAWPSPGGPGLLDADALALVNEAVIAQCDALDGAPDGVLEDPRRCGFDPSRLQCSLGESGSCLTPAQVTAIREIYDGPVVAAESGEPLPGLAIGSEPFWSFATAREPSRLTLEFFRRAVFDDLAWNWRSFDFASDPALAREEAGWMLDAVEPDLSAFRDNGGKLILYHGWNDTNNAPEATIAYYESVETALAGRPNPQSIATRDFARLFMVPGMAHCGGGTGTDVFDAQRAIEDWVERDIAPDRIEASRVEADEIVRTRPLCPYPEIARYRGSGNPDRTGSFVCAF